VKHAEKVWVLAANLTRARLFLLDDDGSSMTEVESFANPEGRSAERAVTTSPPPTVHESAAPARHSIEPHTSLREKQAQQFAHLINEELKRKLLAGDFDRLVVIAAPHFLGVLRKKFDKGILASIDKEIAHDFTLMKADEISERLKEKTVAKSGT
jgi:protein required for attachment to host cells